MPEKRDVVFRRVRGRIVPIRVNKKTEQGVKGAAMVAGGLALSFVAGRARRIGSAAVFRSISRNLQKVVKSKAILRGVKPTAEEIFSSAAASGALRKEAVMKLRVSRRLVGAINKSTGIARLAGIGLTAAGTSEVTKSLGHDKNAAVVGAVAGAAAATSAQGIGLVGARHAFRIVKHNFLRAFR